jgi:predicted anti-sigma-YlaC factor YlaD
MKCEGIEELLSPYLEGNLTPEAKKDVETHLETCKDCSSLLAFLKETMESLSEFPEAEVSESLMNRLYSIPDLKRKFRMNLDFLVRPSLQPVFAAASIVLILLSFYFFHPEKNQFDKAVSHQLHQGYSEIGKLYAKAESFTQSIGEYKDNILVSIKNINPLGREEE